MGLVYISLIPLQKEVSAKGSTTQKYSLIQIRNTIWTIIEMIKNIQYLPTGCVFSISNYFGKYKRNSL